MGKTTLRKMIIDLYNRKSTLCKMGEVCQRGGINKACNACAIVKNVRVNMTKAYEMLSEQRRRLAWTNSLLSACFAASIKPPKNYHGASCSAAVPCGKRN